VLFCSDRVIFKGHLPIANASALEAFVDFVLKIRRADFMAFAQEQSETLVDHAQCLAQQAGAEYRFLQGAHRKDKLVGDILRQRPIGEGLICVLCCMECCGSFNLISGKDRPRLVNARRQQRVVYFHHLDPKLGLIHFRLQTWFPFTVQVYVTKDAGERRRQSTAVGRMLKRLHVCGLIVKVPHSRRWHVSRKGHQVLGAVVQLDHHGIPAAARRAA
jgi:hypothetical protein